MDSSQSGGSAWGGFLKKAMEGVEQQLDRVLENPPPKGIIRGEFGVTCSERCGEVEGGYYAASDTGA